MWYEEFTNKHDVVQYRFYEKYKDPLTDKWKRVSIVMNKNGKQSQKEAQKRLNERIEVKLNDKTPSTLKTLTFHQACDEWFEHYKTVSGSKQSSITSIASRVKLAKKHIAADVLANKINVNILNDLVKSVDEDGISHKYIKDTIRLVRHVMKYLQKKYKIKDISFIDDVDLPKQAKTRDEIKAKRENYLEMDQVKEVTNRLNEVAKQKVSEHIKRTYLISAYIMEFQALNGMRIGELLAIQPQDIDFDNKTLTIDGTIQWIRDKKGHIGIKDTTKTEASYRTISLTTRSCEILKKVMLENKKSLKWGDDYIERGFVFTNFKGSPLSIPCINRLIQSACSDIGIDKHVTTHTMRHTHISLLSQLGVSLKAIMQRVGHTDHKTTLQIYSHVTEQMDKDMMNKLEAVNS
ncbi:site-specific integrase [Mammaliicoccus sp. G-M28]|uniref:tyrosine-type recombinase/integrase n=1 Tax=Mammaliicoccus sp. G-M28 TaxID=2898688 RepID=UPI001EFB62D9|nr:site-specific integrase [Mammaliicoccus sp. G-M28]